MARAYKSIPNDCAAAQSTQAAIAEHNSVHATLTSDKPIVYRPLTPAECAKRSRVEPKLS